MAPLPIKFTEVLQLTSTGIDTAAIGFNSCVSSSRPAPIAWFYFGQAQHNYAIVLLSKHIPSNPMIKLFALTDSCL